MAIKVSQRLFDSKHCQAIMAETKMPGWRLWLAGKSWAFGVRCIAQAIGKNDSKLAQQAWEALCLASLLDPRMADAYLALLAICPDDEDELHEMLLSTISRRNIVGSLGEVQRRYGLELNEYYRPLGFNALTLKEPGDIHALRALQMLAGGKHNEAAEYVEEHLPHDDLRRHAVAGLVAYESGDYSSCLRELYPLIGHELPLSGDACWLVGTSMVHLGFYLEAIDTLQLALATLKARSGERERAVLYPLAVAHALAGQWREAITIYDELAGRELPTDNALLRLQAMLSGSDRPEGRVGEDESWLALVRSFYSESASESGATA